MTKRHHMVVLWGAVALVIFITVIFFLQNGDNVGHVELSSTKKCTPIHEMVCVSEPETGGRVISPLVVRGYARGQWFFEASFPVVLTDWDGRIIAESHAQAESEWMTTDFVPFQAEISFEKPSYGERGTLILKKDNPSGLPEYDAAAEISILFH